MSDRTAGLLYIGAMVLLSFAFQYQMKILASEVAPVLSRTGDFAAKSLQLLHHRALWRLQATTLRNGSWSPMIEFPRATGRIDLALAVAQQRNGGVAAVWATDGRDWPTGSPHEQDLQFAVLPPGKPAPAAELITFQPPAGNPPPSHTDEARDIQRVRAYRANIAGKTFRIARGDVHRRLWLDRDRSGNLELRCCKVWRGIFQAGGVCRCCLRDFAYDRDRRTMAPIAFE